MDLRKSLKRLVLGPEHKASSAMGGPSKGGMF
jgi:hypothetical protein